MKPPQWRALALAFPVWEIPAPFRPASSHPAAPPNRPVPDAQDPQTPFDTVRRFALEFPEAHEDHPWGETVIKVRGKIFVFLGDDDGGFRVTVKLLHRIPTNSRGSTISRRRRDMGSAKAAGSP